MTDPALDDVARIDEIRAAIAHKPLLRAWYDDVYRRYAECLARAPSEGLAIELGAGGGYVQDVLPDVVTTDLLDYPGVDRVVDATRMPFEAGALRAILMTNVFHHLKSPEAFFAEAMRCLAPAGRVLIVDQHPGWLARPIYRHLHHEPFDDRADWGFTEGGPLSGANGAQLFNVFVRDRARFVRDWPGLTLAGYRRFAPLAYWLSGGLRPISLVPGFGVRAVRAVDRALVALSPDAGSFAAVELVRRV